MKNVWFLGFLSDPKMKNVWFLKKCKKNKFFSCFLFCVEVLYMGSQRNGSVAKW